jgi:opacity protein-like surface antigen
MKHLLVVAALVGGGASVAQAQDLALYDPSALATVFEPEATEPALKEGGIAFGLRAGYVTARDADDGTWFGGIQVRVPLGSMFAVEGSIEFHATDYEDGDIELLQYPVHATFLWFILPNAEICPYLLAGVSWWYTVADFSGDLSSLDEESDSMFGAHLGGGVRLGNFSADLRYHFIEPNEDALEDEEFDSFQIVLSYSFGF